MICTASTYVGRSSTEAERVGALIVAVATSPSERNQDEFSRFVCELDSYAVTVVTIGPIPA
jgi:hypothetical protein